LAKVMAWGEGRNQAVKTLQRALLEFRLEGVNCNIPLLRDILATKEFAAAAYHTGSVLVWLEECRNRALDNSAKGKMYHNGNGHNNGHENGEREIAAAIGVSLAMAMRSAQPQNATAAFSPWRVYGRREQLLSRTLGNRGWR